MQSLTGVQRFDLQPEPEQPKEHYLPMKGTIYLDYIISGAKTHEGRVNRAITAATRLGDTLILNEEEAGRGIVCKIVSRNWYSTFREMLEAHGVLNMLPQLTDFSKEHTPEELLAEGIRVYESFPLSDQVKELGCVAMGVKYLKDYKK